MLESEDVNRSCKHCKRCEFSATAVGLHTVLRAGSPTKIVWCSFRLEGSSKDSIFFDHDPFS